MEHRRVRRFIELDGKGKGETAMESAMAGKLTSSLGIQHRY